jgi:DNA-binding NarL/FixJ family response regulator
MGSTGPGDALRVVVADDSERYRAVLVRTLAAAGHEVVGEAADGAEALRLARALAPGAAVLDLRMPRASGSDVARALRAEGRRVVVLIVSVYDEPEVVLEALAAGAHGFVAKSDGPRELLDGLAAVVAGRVHVPRGVDGAAAARAAGCAAP